MHHSQHGFETALDGYHPMSILSGIMPISMHETFPPEGGLTHSTDVLRGPFGHPVWFSWFCTVIATDESSSKEEEKRQWKPLPLMWQCCEKRNPRHLFLKRILSVGVGCDANLKSRTSEKRIELTILSLLLL